MASTTDRIEKKILLKVPLERVWSAISDSARFGAWFGMKLDGPFEPGARLTGTDRADAGGSGSGAKCRSRMPASPSRSR